MARGTEPVKRGDSWTAVVDIGPDPVTGKRRRKRVTARTKREVEHSLSGSVHPVPAPLGTTMAPRPALSRRRVPAPAAPLPPSPR